MAKKKIFFSELALKDLEALPSSIINLFYPHFDKILEHPPRPKKHLKHGNPYYREDVGQGRIAYRIIGDTVYIIRCFEHHKEYDKWLGTFK